MANPAQFGSFVPTTNIWDPVQISSLNIPPDLKELLIRMYQNLNLMSVVLNTKDSGYYDLQEFVNGQLFFPPMNSGSQTNPYIAPAYRQVFRKILNLAQVAGVALPAGVTNVNHNIIVTPTLTFTRIYGVANDPATNNYYPLPWASAGGATNIEVIVNATQVVITNNSGITFSNCYIVLEFIKY